MLQTWESLVPGRDDPDCLPMPWYNVVLNLCELACHRGAALALFQAVAVEPEVGAFRARVYGKSACCPLSVYGKSACCPLSGASLAAPPDGPLHTRLLQVNGPSAHWHC